MQQEEFDSFILTMDFLFVRGEDSLARAALSGLPFAWQAYKQEENYQLVKVSALLERMRPFFPKEDFTAIEKFWKSYNDYESLTDAKALEKLLLASRESSTKKGFENFAGRLHKNGNLAAHLLSYIDSLP